MISAEEIVEYRRNCMRTHLEEQMKEFVDKHYLGYSTTTHNCPSWLREELIEAGYEVSLFGMNDKCVQILFGEKERE